MIDFYHEPDTVEHCPHCGYILALNPEFPDLVVYTCPGCHRSYSPTDLNKIYPATRDPYTWLAALLIFVGWPAFLFLLFLVLSWIF